MNYIDVTFYWLFLHVFFARLLWLLSLMILMLYPILIIVFIKAIDSTLHAEN